MTSRTWARLAPLLRHKETGIEYRLAGHDPLQARTRAKDAVTCFVVYSASSRFLPRGEQVPTEVIEHGEVYGGEVRGNALVDRKTSKAYVLERTGRERQRHRHRVVVTRGRRRRSGGL